MRFLSLRLALALDTAVAFFPPPSARAQRAPETSQAKAATEQPGRSSIGAGFGLYFDGGGLSGLSGLSGLGSLGAGSTSSSTVTPFGTALFEWAATRSLRLMVGTSGSYAKRLRFKGEESSGAPLSRWSAGLGIGLRWVLNPGQLVEFSPALLLGVHGGKARDVLDNPAFPQLPEQRADYASFGVDARIGFVLEHGLLPQLYLRFECYLLRGGVEIRARRGDFGRERQGEAGLGWGLAPMLQLRLTL